MTSGSCRGHTAQPPGCCLLFARPKVVHGPRSDLLYILTLGTYSKIARENISQRSAFASRSHARALAAGLPRQDHTDPFVRFHKQKFNEMPCRVDPTQNLHSFEKYPTLPQDRVRSPRNGLCIAFGRSASGLEKSTLVTTQGVCFWLF